MCGYRLIAQLSVPNILFEAFSYGERETVIYLGMELNAQSTDSSYVRVYETMNDAELTLIKLAFAENEIRFRTRFEKTMQIANVAALGYNGAVFEVEEVQIEEARKVLSDMGIKCNAEHSSLLDQPFFALLDSRTATWPILGKLDLNLRLLFLLFVILSVFYLIMAYIMSFQI